MAMLRHHEARDSDADVRLVVSARGAGDVLFAGELARLGERPSVRVATTLTREQPPGWTGYARRVDAGMLAEVGPDPAAAPGVFVCGPTPFVEHAADLLVGLGHARRAVHTERFGPTGR
jgi:ferredoxin-NADP reductase